LVAGVVDGEMYVFELVVHDGLDTSAPSTVRILTDHIFADGFESGDLSGWSFLRLGGDPARRGDP
jgi:hypothetical protein